MYPAWTFWTGGPVLGHNYLQYKIQQLVVKKIYFFFFHDLEEATTVYPSGLGRWDILRKGFLIRFKSVFI